MYSIVEYCSKKNCETTDSDRTTLQSMNCQALIKTQRRKSESARTTLDKNPKVCIKSDNTDD